MDEVKEKELRKEILEKTAEYYRQILKPQQNMPFISGDTKIPYAGHTMQTAVVDVSSHSKREV